MKATVTWLAKVINITAQSSAAIQHTFTLWSRYVDSRGLKWTVQRWKTLRLCVTRYLCDQPLRVVEGVGIRKDGLPKALGPINDLILSKDPLLIKFALTLLTISRPIEGPVEPKLECISSPWNGQFHEGLMSWLPIFASQFKVPLTEWDAPHWSTKRGPSGQAMQSSIGELLSIPYWHLQALKCLGGPYFEKYLAKLLKVLKGVNLKEPFQLRKLSFIKDKEMKTRTIAILDYWSQTVLKPYHDTVMGFLRKLPGDFTYQGDVRRHFSDKPGIYHSFDLKDATDRFPIAMQKELFSLIFGAEAADAWSAIMVGQPFHYKLPSGETGIVRYGSGQPMGAYSSWAVFALSHHAVLQYIKSVYKETEYAILGDDIVIKGENGACLYREIMLTMDVPISENKTHVSKHGFEFAKRWFIGPNEMTPYPLWATIEAGTDPFKIVAAFNSASGKGWSAEIICRTGVIRDYLVQVFGLHCRSAEHKARRAMIFKDLSEILKSDEEPMQLTPKVVGLATRLLDPGSQSFCNHERHVVGSLQRAVNDSSAKLAYQAITALDRTANDLMGETLKSLPPALDQVHPARLASEHLLESLNEGSTFYRDLAAYHRAGLRTTGIPLYEKYSSLAGIVPLAKFPLPGQMFERVAVQVMNAEVKMIKILIEEWVQTYARPGDQDLRSPTLGRILANASLDCRRSIFGPSATM